MKNKIVGNYFLFHVRVLISARYVFKAAIFMSGVVS